MPPSEVLPPPSPRKYWTRRGLAEWLVAQLSGDKPTLVGIDHGFSFPLAYFEKHQLARDWPKFLDDFQKHWPTDAEHTYVDFVRDGLNGNGAARVGNSRWRRLTELRAGAAKSVFHFDCRGRWRNRRTPVCRGCDLSASAAANRVHFWPFDGWEIPAGRSVLAEVYPALWMRQFPTENRTDDQHAAFSVASWLRNADMDGALPGFFQPPLEPPARTQAEIEGWIFGVKL